MGVFRGWKKVAVAAGMVTALTVGAGVGAIAQSGDANSGGAAAPDDRAGASSPTESVFVPITPCRIVNTATSGAGKLGPNVTRAYESQGNTSSQGGAAACGIPSTASALEINMTAPLANSDGYLRVAPAGVAIPNATFMNYVAGFNASNAGTIAVTKGTGNNFQVKSFNSSTHVVIDVLGYYVDDLFAVVEGNGTLVRGNGVTSVVKAGTGDYRVVFDRNLRGCGYTGNVGQTGDLGSQADGSVTVAGDNANVNGVYVSTHNQAGTGTDRPFHLTVDC